MEPTAPLRWLEGKRIDARPNMSQDHALNVSRHPPLHIPLRVARLRDGLRVVLCAPPGVKAIIDTEDTWKCAFVDDSVWLANQRATWPLLSPIGPTAVDTFRAEATCAVGWRFASLPSQSRSPKYHWSNLRKRRKISLVSSPASLGRKVLPPSGLGSARQSCAWQEI